jgi:hypothetical protein
MNGLREFLKTTGGQILGSVVALAAIVLMIWMIRGYFGPSDAAKLSLDRIFVDAANGKPFEHVISPGEKFPVKAPSGGNTGYPAELCYWTKDGKIKSEPTPVLINQWVGKPGPTFCPDCGRLVIGHNPYPAPGAKPPPTQAEYRAAPDEGR